MVADLERQLNMGGNLHGASSEEKSIDEIYHARRFFSGSGWCWR